MEWFIPKSRKDKRFRTVYAHNGGGWDWISLVDHLRTDKSFRLDVDGVPPKYHLHIARAQSKMILMVMTFPGQFSIKFCDSQYLLRSSLEKLCKSFDVPLKVKLDGKLPHEIYLTRPAQYFDYLRTDCGSLLLVLERSLDLLRSIAAIDRLGSTIGSTAMKVFRTGYLRSSISIPVNEDERLLLREGYRGGRVEVFQYGYFPKVWIYDVNSLYPSAMVSTDIPTSGRMVPTHLFRSNCVGVYRIKFRQYRRDILPIFNVLGNGAYEGYGVFFSPEIALCKRLDPNAIIEIEEGYIFPEVGRPFEGYVKTLYQLRLDNPGKAIELLAKYLLNSLYGKFAQRGEREQLILFEDDASKIATYRRWRKENQRLPKAKRKRPWEITHDGLAVGCIESTTINFEHVGIAGIITSQARVILYNYLLEAGKDNVLYADTDSIHSTVPLLNHHCSTDLGGLKLESSCDGDEAIYCGKKLYAIKTAEKTRIRAKGVSIGGKHGHDLHWDNMLAISKGAKVKCHFSQPASVLDCLKGNGGVCRIGNEVNQPNRHRTLQLT